MKTMKSHTYIHTSNTEKAQWVMFMYLCSHIYQYVYVTTINKEEKAINLRGSEVGTLEGGRGRGLEGSKEKGSKEEGSDVLNFN